MSIFLVRSASFLSPVRHSVVDSIYEGVYRSLGFFCGNKSFIQTQIIGLVVAKCENLKIIWTLVKRNCHRNIKTTTRLMNGAAKPMNRLKCMYNVAAFRTSIQNELELSRSNRAEKRCRFVGYERVSRACHLSINWTMQRREDGRKSTAKVATVCRGCCGSSSAEVMRQAEGRNIFP